MFNKKEMENKFDCAVIGNWHLAYVTAACLTKLGHKILLVNTENQGNEELPPAPVYEPGLPELLTSAKLSGKLSYTEGFKGNWKANCLWLAIDTPVNDHDEVDLTSLYKVLREVNENRKVGTGFLIISSQVPLGFCQDIEEQFGFRVAYIPENLRLGHGIETFLKADRTVVGANDIATREDARYFLNGLDTEFFLCDLPTSEMVKHATNAFLATSISFANEIARIGEKYGVNSLQVGEALRLDKRIGKKAYVVPGLGFAGGTLPRDLRVLQKLAVESKTPSRIVDAVLNVNDSTTDAVKDMVVHHFNSKLEDKKILLLGYTYKAETNTLRRSLSVELASLFLDLGANVWGFDPFMNSADLSLFHEKFQHFSSWDAIPGCPDVILLMTPRKEFRSLDWNVLKAKSGFFKPLIIDLRSGLAPTELVKRGFTYKGLWQPVQTPEEGART